MRKSHFLFTFLSKLLAYTAHSNRWIVQKWRSAFCHYCKSTVFSHCRTEFNPSFVPHQRAWASRHVAELRKQSSNRRNNQGRSRNDEQTLGLLCIHRRRLLRLVRFHYCLHLIRMCETAATHQISLLFLLETNVHRFFVQLINHMCTYLFVIHTFPVPTYLPVRARLFFWLKIGLRLISVFLFAASTVLI